MTTNNLTELWKKGELEKGYYYVKGIKKYDGINVYWIGYPIHELERRWITEVLAPVPSYEEYSRLEWYAGCGPDRIVELNKENRQLRKWCEEFNALNVAEENQKLKECLKNCRELFDTWDYPNIVKEIDEVLK